ncbi:MAG: hypothetical protein KatS3mg105_3113 [Gemmatales bacterium]|nr:MAG: hypothetical protein KatS3mg105_3113 [Gemmatales bacterium]
MVKSLRALTITGIVFSLSHWPAPAADELPPLIKSARSGIWSQRTTWEGGQVPGQGDRVLIREGHRVVYDIQSDRAIRSIFIAGTLSFDPDKDTRLNVGLLKPQACEDCVEEGFDCEARLAPPEKGKRRAALEIGTPDRPISSNHRAHIRLVYFPGMNKETLPALVCCGGRLDIHGAPMSRTWVKLGATAKAGDQTIELAEAVQGWRKGDRIVVTATRRDDRGNKDFNEVRFIKAIEGKTIELDQPLAYEHLGDGEYRGEVANLSRNVVIESADPDGIRGHTMYHRHSAGAISYAEFRHLGKEGVLGKYSLHYHLVGSTMRGSYVIGNSIWDSHNRWLTIHGTNYLIVRDNVGFKSIGHGFFLEDGTEVFNVLDRNLAIAARRGKRLPKQVLPFDPNEGAGFWWANSLNTFTRNVATANDEYGFRFEATAGSSFPVDFPILQPDGSRKIVDIRTLPFVRFEDNEVHSSVGHYGFNLGMGVRRVGPDARHPFIVRNTKIWDVHYAFRPQVPSLLVENLHIHRAVYGVYHPNFDNHVYRNVLISETNAEPFNRGHDDHSTQYGKLAVDGLVFKNIRAGGMPLIQLSDHNPEGKAESHFRGIQLVDWNDRSKQRALVNLGGGPRYATKTPTSVPTYIYDWFGPGRHALVVSTRSPEFKSNPKRYKEVPDLTGDESRAVEVRELKFPKLLDPVDDLPPTTVITHVLPTASGLVVRGVAADNGTIKGVEVNGRPAKAVRRNFAEWEIILEGNPKAIKAHATDAAGNVEQLPHVRRVVADGSINK